MSKIDVPDLDPDYDLITCPACKHMDTLDGFDVSGACKDNVFCIQCHREFDMFAGQPHGRCDECQEHEETPLDRKAKEYRAMCEEIEAATDCDKPVQRTLF